MRGMRHNNSRENADGNNDINTSARGKSTNLIEEEQDNKQSNDSSCTRQTAHPRNHHRPRVSRHVKESRQFIKILRSAVFLFYVSWLPIIVSVI